MAAVSTEQQLRFRWNDHMQHVSKILTLQRLEEHFCDVTLVTEDGFVMKAHQAILASTSAYFQRVLSEVTSDQYPMIVLRGASFREMSCLLDYMYQGNTQVDHSLMERVLEVADMLEVKGLSRIRSNISIKKFMGTAASPNTNSKTSPLNVPCTDNPRGSTKSPEDQFYCGNQVDTRITDTESTQMKLTSSACDSRGTRDTQHLPGDGPPISHTQPVLHTSQHEVEPQDDDDMTQTSGIDLSMAKNEPWSPREGDALSGQKEDSGDESPSKKKKKHQESLCSEERLDPVLDPDWGRIGTKLEERTRHKPRTISLTSITTTDNDRMSWLSDDEHGEDDDGGYVRAVTPGPVETQHPFSDSISCVKKLLPVSDPSTSRYSFDSFPLARSSTCYASSLPKYPRSQSCMPFVSLNNTPLDSQIISMTTLPQHMPVLTRLKTLSIDQWNIQNAVNASENLLDEGETNEPHILSQAFSRKANESGITEAGQVTKGFRECLQSLYKNKLYKDIASQECLKSPDIIKSDEESVLESDAYRKIKTEFSSLSLPVEYDKVQSLDEAEKANFVVFNENDINHKSERQSFHKKEKYTHANYVNMQLKEVKVENKLLAQESRTQRQEKNSSRLNVTENGPEQVELEPLCPLEKMMIRKPKNKIKRPLNQYMLFQKEMREKVRAKYPGETHSQIISRLGYLWRTLPLSEKAKWQARAKYVKEEHKRLHPEYRYNPRRASNRRQEYIAKIALRRNLYRIKPLV
ncbi:hypothetical protein OTU49_016288 [Cherax quadricarinatus]